MQLVVQGPNSSNGGVESFDSGWNQIPNNHTWWAYTFHSSKLSNSAIVRLRFQLRGGTGIQFDADYNTQYYHHPD